MRDIPTMWVPAEARGDWVAPDPSQPLSDLETAVLISLFSDATATPSDVIPDGSGDPRGWWGDQGEDTPIGSRLWLYERAKRTSATLNAVRDAIKAALAWLVTDQVAGRVDIECEWQPGGRLAARIGIVRPTGDVVSLAYAWAWGTD